MSQSTPSLFPFESPHKGSDSHGPEILLSALLENYLKSRLSPESGPMTDDIFSKLSAHFSNVGIIPAASARAACRELSLVRRSSLATVDRLLLQAVKTGILDSPDATELGPSTHKNAKGGRASQKTKYPSFESLLRSIRDANPESADNPNTGSQFETALGGTQAQGGNTTQKGKESAVGTTGFKLEAPGRSRILPPPSRYSHDFVELAKLGNGGYGTVFRARNHLDGVEYAVKKVILKRNSFGRGLDGLLGGLQEVMKEVKILASLQHPNVVRYFGGWVEGTADEVLATLKFPKQLGGIDPQDPSAKPPASGESSAGVGLSGHIPGCNADGVGKCSGAIAPELPPYPSQFAQGTSGRGGKHLVALKQHPRNFNPDIGLVPPYYGTPLASPHPDDVWGSQMGILYIQMSLHPLSLKDFVGWELNPIASHCFCPIASLKIFLELAQGVEYLHSQGIVHRDLKSANIFLDVDFAARSCQCVQAMFAVKVKIGDFGISKYISDYFPTTPAVSLGDPVGWDIFSLGVLLFELVYPPQGCKFLHPPQQARF